MALVCELGAVMPSAMHIGPHWTEWQTYVCSFSYLDCFQDLLLWDVGAAS